MSINDPLAGEAMARSLAEVDPEIHGAVHQETEKQATKLVLIASENYASEAVLSTCSSVMSVTKPSLVVSYSSLPHGTGW